ncbi:MAG: gamma carbonic anhydrase family protein [Spirochaetia bacterium]
MIHAIGNNEPKVPASAWIAWNAEVAGMVELGVNVSIWFSASVRGDIARISIGQDSNIQDGSVVHVDHSVPAIIGESVTVGHSAVLHSCEIEDNCLVGMGAIVLSRAKIGEYSIVGAGALVTEDKVFPPRSLILGSPAKRVRDVTKKEMANILQNAKHYVQYSQQARTDYREI